MAGPNLVGPQPNVVVTPDPSGTYNRYDTLLASDPTNPQHLVGLCRRFFGPGANYQDVLEVQQSVDGGQQWSSSPLAMPANLYSLSDPWIGVAGNGTIYVVTLAVAQAGAVPGSGVYCYASTNQGASWTTTLIPGSNGGNPDQTFGGVDMRAGASRVYAIWNSNASTGGAAFGALAFAYSDDGINWQTSTSALAGGNTIYDVTAGGFNFVNLSVAPDDGSVHIVGATGAALSYAQSLDRGVTVTVGAITSVLTGTGDFAATTAPQLLAIVPVPAILAAGGGLLFAGMGIDTGQTPAVPGPRMRVCVASCADGGARWANTTLANAPANTPLLPLGNLSQTPQDQYLLPRFAAMPNGIVGCAFRYIQLSAAPPPAVALTTVQFSTCLAVSRPTDAYPTYFDPNSTSAVIVSDRATSPLSSNPVQRWGSAQDIFTGDFIGLAANASGFFPYWSDTRSSTPGAASAQIITSYLAVQAPACSLIIDRGTYGEYEVTAALNGASATFVDAVYVVVDGFAPSQFGLTTNLLPNPPAALLPVLTGSVLGNAGVTLSFDASSTTGGVQLEDSANLNAIQRITYPFNVVFSIPPGSQSIQAFNALNATGNGSAVYGLSASVTTVATAMAPAVTTASSTADIVFVTQADPYMQAGATWYLSNDMRVFTVTPATLGASAVGLPGTQTTYAMGSAPTDYISALIDEFNTRFTDPTAGLTPFDNIPAGEDQSALMLSQYDTNANAVFNFALARVHLKGAAAQNVRVFFRLFISPSPDTDYDPVVTFPTAQGTDSSGNKTVIPLLGVPTADMPSTIPFFAAARVPATTTSMTQQTDPKNVQNIPSLLISNPPAAGAEVYAYFGCWLDLNQPQAQFPLNPAAASTLNGPWGAPSDMLVSIPAIIMSNHACLVTEISYDHDPIPLGANAATSDKIGQRNLSWTSSDNPGSATAHRIPTLLDLRPTRALSSPTPIDELMIEWGNTPMGSVASLYWPQLDANAVLDWAARLYRTRQLRKVDAHTIQCKTGTITYLPIPPDTSPKIAGLMTVDLPPTVRAGQELHILVRRLSSRSVGKAAANIRDSRSWRYVVGAFQINIPVSIASRLLATEESVLALYKWKIDQIPVGNRWYPVLQRFIAQTSGRVTGFGGNAASVQASGSGLLSGVLGLGNRQEYTGKVVGIMYDRFGDFEGFLLCTEAGTHVSFQARELAMERHIREAWVERTVISVFVEAHAGERPIRVILRRYH